MTNIAQIAARSPESAQLAFDRVDEALNMVLPGSDTHKRYEGIQSVGLAVVVATSRPGFEFYNPLDPNVLSEVSFTANNFLAHPEAWAPVATDEQFFGRKLPDGMGRFTAFALGKANNLNISDADTSLGDQVTIRPGVFGLAGAQRIRSITYSANAPEVSSAIVSASGLWEIHDHIAGRIFTDDIETLYTQGTGDLGPTDELAARMERIFGTIKMFHADTEATDIKRRELPRLLMLADTLLDITQIRG